SYWTAFWLLSLLLLAGCGQRNVQIPTSLEQIPGVLQELQDFSIEDVEVSDLTASLGEYLAVYNSQFDIRERRGTTPLAIAEAYLREYQPGPLPRVFQTTVIYDRHGTKLAEIVDEGYRTWIPLNRISPHLINALLAT